MDMRHRIVEIKRFILIAGNKIHDQLVHQVRHILLVLQFHLFSVEGVLLPLGLSIPKIPLPLNVRYSSNPKSDGVKGNCPHLPMDADT